MPGFRILICSRFHWIFSMLSGIWKNTVESGLLSTFILLLRYYDGSSRFSDVHQHPRLISIPPSPGCEFKLTVWYVFFSISDVEYWTVRSATVRTRTSILHLLVQSVQLAYLFGYLSSLGLHDLTVKGVKYSWEFHGNGLGCLACQLKCTEFDPLCPQSTCRHSLLTTYCSLKTYMNVYESQLFAFDENVL